MKTHKIIETVVKVMEGMQMESMTEPTAAV